MSTIEYSNVVLYMLESLAIKLPQANGTKL